MKTINEACCIKHGICGPGVSIELVNEFSELLDILRNRRGLFHIEELAHKEFFLITIETIMQKSAKIVPIIEIEVGFNRLEPTSCSTIEMLFGDMNPKRGRNSVHLEIVLAERVPVTRIVTVETRKRQFGQAASVTVAIGV
jgi:hypothetical protein